VSPPHDPTGLVARYTPDDSRRRWLVAVASGVGAVLAWYGATAVITGVKSGLVYNLVILVLLVATFILPAYAAAAVLADDSGVPQWGSSTGPVETLKRRYAAGEIDEATFQRRLDTLVRRTDRREAGGEDGSAPTADDEYASAPTADDEHGSTPTTDDEHGSAPTTDDEHGSTPESEFGPARQ
jgi:uncharacterized membrane protein